MFVLNGRKFFLFDKRTRWRPGGETRGGEALLTFSVYYLWLFLINVVDIIKLVIAEWHQAVTVVKQRSVSSDETGGEFQGVFVHVPTAGSGR